MSVREKTARPLGRIVPAPENHLGAAVIQAAKGRRGFLASAAAGGLAVAAAGKAGAQAKDAPPAINPWTRSLGAPVGATGYGTPSKFEAAVQRRQSPGLTPQPQSSVSFTPLQNLFGIITPSGVHFERHHSGMPEVDPVQHRLMIHGLVKRPLVLSMDDLMRFPSVSRIHFIECGANSGMEWANVAVPDGAVLARHARVQRVHRRAAVDAARRSRFRQEERALHSCRRRRRLCTDADDPDGVRVGRRDGGVRQNGEMLRPENGYPLRLLVPGVQGVSSVKWLRRIEVGDKPWNAREESLHYIDLMPDGTHRQYSGVQEVKSVITTPSGGQLLQGKGYYEITGLAWSGRGKIRRVDVSVDGGRNWQPARLQDPVLSKALTRFRMDWNWNGGPALLQSRAVDDTGHVQPTIAQLRAVRGTRSIYHNNAIKTWKRAAQRGGVECPDRLRQC